MKFMSGAGGGDRDGDRRLCSHVLSDLEGQMMMTQEVLPFLGLSSDNINAIGGDVNRNRGGWNLHLLKICVPCVTKMRVK